MIRLYSGSVDYYVKISDELRRFSVEHIAPVLGEGPVAFYDESGALRPRYKTYPWLVMQLRLSMVGAVEAAEQLEALLDALQEYGTRLYIPATRASSQAQPRAA